MDKLVETICGSISRAEHSRRLDWRFSYSSVQVTAPRRVLVELSREEIMGDVLASLGSDAHAHEWEGAVEVETSAGTIVTLRLLEPAPGRALWVTTSVADIRRNPAHAAELVNQLIMGERAEPLKRQGDWCLARLEDGYHGWICSWYVSEVDGAVIEEYRARINVRVGATIGYVLSDHHDDAIPVSDLVAGSRLVAGDIVGGFREVILPIDRKGFIKEDAHEPLHHADPSRSRLVRVAQRFLGIPYLWGGTSAKAFDCSGFVKRVFQHEGIELPRDSDLQAQVGVPIPIGGSEHALPGDLLFFGEGETIKHVAISIGSGRFIHAYGSVRINSLHRDDPLYEEKLATSFLFVRSVLDRAR